MAERLRYGAAASVACMGPEVARRPASVTEIIGTARAQRRRQTSARQHCFRYRLRSRHDPAPDAMDAESSTCAGSRSSPKISRRTAWSLPNRPA